MFLYIYAWLQNTVLNSLRGLFTSFVWIQFVFQTLVYTPLKHHVHIYTSADRGQQETVVLRAFRPLDREVLTSTICLIVIELWAIATTTTSNEWIYTYKYNLGLPDHMSNWNHRFIAMRLFVLALLCLVASAKLQASWRLANLYPRLSHSVHSIA